MKTTQIMSIEDRSKQGIVLKANALTFVLVSFPKLLMFHGFFFMFHIVFKDLFARYFLILYSIRNYFLCGNSHVDMTEVLRGTQCKSLSEPKINYKKYAV